MSFFFFLSFFLIVILLFQDTGSGYNNEHGVDLGVKLLKKLLNFYTPSHLWLLDDV